MSKPNNNLIELYGGGGLLDVDAPGRGNSNYTIYFDDCEYGQCVQFFVHNFDMGLNSAIEFSRAYAAVTCLLCIATWFLQG